VTFAAGSTRPTHQAQIVSIVNTSNEIYLYLPAQSGRGGAYNATTGILTLEIVTTAMNSGDALQIVIDDSEIGATSALQAAGNVLLGGIGDKLPPLDGGRWPVSGPLTDVELRAQPVPVSGTFWPATQPVSGTFWQTTQPVSGPLTNVQLTARLPILTLSGTRLQVEPSLATDASTATNQAASNVALGSIDGRLGVTGTDAPTLPTGASGLAGLVQVFYQALLDRLPATLSGGRLQVAPSLAADAATATNQEIINNCLGTTNETPPNSDTASAGLNGRMQRLAQGLSSILLKLPAFGTAGAPSSDVLTVQGASSGTVLPVAPNVTRGVGNADGSTQRVTLASDSPAVISLAAIASSQPDVQTTSAASSDRGSVVRHAPCSQWKADFSSTGSNLLAPELVLRSSSSLVVSQASGNLLVNTGTATNAELLCRSAVSFRGTVALRWRLLPSQRIANSNLMVLLADRIGENLAYTCTATNVVVTFPGHSYTSANVGQSMMLGAITGAAGIPGRYPIASVGANTITFTVTAWPASSSGTLDLFGHSYVQQLYSGTANATLDAQRGGWNTGSVTMTAPLYANIHSASIQLDGRTAAACRSGIGDVLNLSALRSDIVPDDSTNLFLYLWAYNGSTAPASGTTWTILSLSLEENANIPLYLAGMKQSGFGSPLAMTGAVTVLAGTALASDVGVQYRASVTGGATPAKVISSAASPSSILKVGVTRPLGWNLANTTTLWVYAKLYNSTTATAGTAGVVIPIAIPPNGISRHFNEGGLTGFATGLTLTTVTGAADSSATAAPDGAIVGSVFFA
jgi:hypothetical protein